MIDTASSNKLIPLIEAYKMLPVGILVVSKEFRPIYFNQAYEKIIEYGIYEFDTWDNCHNEIISSLKKQSHKEFGVFRFLETNGESRIFKIFISKDSLKDLIVCTIIPNKNEEELFHSPKRNSYFFDSIRIDLNRQTVKYKRKQVLFSQLEFNIFVYLLQNEGALVTKEDLLLAVWKKRFSNSRAVDITVNRCRKRLESAGCRKNYIQTVHGRGFIFSI